MLQWANARVAEAGKARRIASFADAALASGLFLLDLLSAVEPGRGPRMSLRMSLKDHKQLDAVTGWLIHSPACFLLDLLSAVAPRCMRRPFHALFR